MSLDSENRCGLGWLSTSKNDWMHPVCSFHDERWLANYSFLGATREFAMYSFNRAKMLGKSPLKPLVYVAIGTVVGAPIWFGRKFFRLIKGENNE